VKPGQALKAGQPIVRLDARVADANFREKKITREGLEASLRLLKALPRPAEQKLLQLAIDDAKVSVQKAESVVARLQPLRERKPGLFISFPTSSAASQLVGFRS
ncbi:MAG TPA: hypothetical protein VJX69_14335, partial [Terriglobales bacterium]|nr:hypothetical protein [Terriglobales bacterium]